MSDKAAVSTGFAGRRLHVAVRRARAGDAGRLRLLMERYLLVAIWAVVAGFFAITRSKSFLQTATLHSIFGGSAVFVLLGLAAFCTCVVAEIDLSVPFMMGLSATIVPLLVSEHGVAAGLAAFVAVAVAAVCGVLNALVIVTFKVDALVATLGSGTVFLGIAEGISHQTPVAGLSKGFSTIAIHDVLGLPLVFWYGIALAVFLAYLLAFTPLGRHMAFVGANREVARLAGIRVNRIRFGAYASGGLIAGFAGVMLSAQLGGFDSSSGSNYLLPTFAVVFLSAAVVRPGAFHAIGVVIAAYFISTGTLGLELFGYSGWTQQVFYGGALVVAVTVVTLVRTRSRRAA
jgi:ribose transport system permease protein